MARKNEKTERKEAFFRILVLIISGIIMWAWGYLAGILVLINLIYTVIANERNQNIAEFVEYWNTQLYAFSNYMSGMSNERPFPFNNLHKISKFKK